jgi:N-acetylglutamate synthase-like GNAT family acetyltransferase
MIDEVKRSDVPDCVELIRESFATVARQFGITKENAPRFTAFATTEERLLRQFDEHRPMYAFRENGRIIGYYSLFLKSAGECELNNLCVSPAHRHGGTGGALLNHAFLTAKALGFSRMDIGIIEENSILRSWYEAFGFIHTGTKTFDFFPFTCGYMEKKL